MVHTPTASHIKCVARMGNMKKQLAANLVLVVLLPDGQLDHGDYPQYLHPCRKRQLPQCLEPWRDLPIIPEQRWQTSLILELGRHGAVYHQVENLVGSQCSKMEIIYSQSDILALM